MTEWVIFMAVSISVSLAFAVVAICMSEVVRDEG
jgi:hypothetical protein